MRGFLIVVFYLLLRRTTAIGYIRNRGSPSFWISTREIFAATIYPRICDTLICISCIIIYPLINTIRCPKFHISEYTFFTCNSPLTPLTQLSTFISTCDTCFIPCFSFSAHCRLNTITPHSDKSWWTSRSRTTTSTSSTEFFYFCSSPRIDTCAM